jgi:hypothetical protein
MKYVCVENNKVISILKYAPTVPDSVTVVTITDEQYANMTAGNVKFDTATLTVVPYSAEELQVKQIKTDSNNYRSFLNNTDWKVLRHVREQALGITTSLTQEEYLDLEQQRENAARNIQD